MSKLKSITFFYPSKIIGGAEFLFIRLAETISQEFNIPIYYTDFLDGFARKNLKNNGMISFIDFYRFKRHRIPPDTVVVAPLSSVVDLLKFTSFEGTFKILFWSIHPFGLKNVLKHYLKGNNNVKIFKDDLSKFIALNGIVFMDGPNYNIQKETFQFKGNSSYLPIPVILNKKRDPHLKNKEIKITWLGRLSEEKIFGLLNVLKHADEFASKSSKFIEVNIIGEGQAARLLVSENFPNLKITKHGSLISSRLQDVLINDTDVIFAMGTSALEGGALAIPTVLVDLSYSQIPISNSFKWLYETKDFSLAEEYRSGRELEGHVFDELMNGIMTQYDIYSERCYEYVVMNHSIPSVSSALIETLNKTELSIDNLKTSTFANFGNLNMLSIIKSYLSYLCKKF